MAESGISSSDESFVSFAFAVVSVLLIIIYIPWLIRNVRGILTFYTSSKQARVVGELENPLGEVVPYLTAIPKTLLFLASNPGTLTTGASICAQEKIFFIRCVMPKFLKYIIRPKILVLWLWIVLLTSAMYSTLTFDAHAVLGVPPTASIAEIKRAYRSMSKVYHPDHNKTDAARETYTQMRRAYKALVDRESFEEEEMSRPQDFSVGIALPRFMTMKENEGMVLFGLLGLLFGLPLYLYYRFRSDHEVVALIKHIKRDRDRVERFMQLFGVPVDYKMIEKRDSQEAVRKILKAIGVAGSDQLDMTEFPSIGEFILRAAEHEKYAVYFHNLGFDDEMLRILHDYCAANGEDILNKFIQEHPVRAVEPMKMLSRSAYIATRYLFQQHTLQVDGAIKKLKEAFRLELSTLRKIEAAHEEMYTLLDLVYNSANKPNPKHVEQLMEMPARVAELLDKLEPEMNLRWRKMQQQQIDQMIDEQVASKRTRRNMKLALKQQAAQAAMGRKA
jgi:translocation protein SEC63